MRQRFFVPHGNLDGTFEKYNIIKIYDAVIDLKCTVALNAEYFQLLRAAVYVGNIRQYCRKKMVTVCLKVDCIKKGVCYTVAMFIFGRSGSEQEERNMSLQFIMGNSGAGKSRYAYQKILAEAMRHPEKTYLIIVPEQFTMQTQKELVSLHPAGGILNVDILSFQRLAYRILRRPEAVCTRCSKKRERVLW